MYGEIDLESYTISIIRLNTAFLKLEDEDSIDEVSEMFEESFNDLNKIYNDIVDELNQNEVNLNEYYLFFKNGRQTFPQYIEALSGIENAELRKEVNSLLNVFGNLNKIAEGFE
jgi:exonuclease VII small subunit